MRRRSSHRMARVRHHQVGLGAVQEALDMLWIRGVPAHQAVLPECPDVPEQCGPMALALLY